MSDVTANPGETPTETPTETGDAVMVDLTAAPEAAEAQAVEAELTAPVGSEAARPN